ncbi:LysR family transcriptional regulator [soil metagenome]
MNVTLRQLRALVTVAETTSFRVAAERLNLTPSAVSLLIKELEAAVGIALFVRSTRRVALSHAGAEFLPHASQVLQDLERALTSAQGLRSIRRGRIRLACTQLYAATLLPPVLASYRAKYPDIEVALLDSLNQQALQRVSTAEADIGIAPQRPTPSNVESTTLFRDAIVLFCPKDHRLAAKRSVSWSQLLGEPFVSLTQDFTTRLQADLLRHSDALQLQPAFNVNFVTTAFGMVRAGYGVTAQPDVSTSLAVPFELERRRLINPVVYRHLCLYQRKDEQLSPAAQSFIEHLQTSLGSARSGSARGATS